MKTGNLFLISLCLVIVTGIYATNVFLKKEYQKIDLTDPYKNYVSVTFASYSVLDISGSNGYPIEIVHKKTNDVKVLRSRLDHFKSTLRNDTLFIQFTGSNIPMAQRFNSKVPAGIIIENNELSSVINSNMHARVTDFSIQKLKLSLKGNSLTEINNCNLNTMDIDMKNSSQIEFLNTNTVDSLYLTMENTSIARLETIEFKTIKQSLSDSIFFVLSKETFNRILKQ